MNLAEAGWLADENIPPKVVTALQQLLDIGSVRSIGLRGASDESVLAHAFDQKLVVLTQDNDFGELVIAKGQPFFGIVFLRPGNYSADDCREAIGSLLNAGIYPEPPFLIVINKTQAGMRLRIRNLHA